MYNVAEDTKIILKGRRENRMVFEAAHNGFMYTVGANFQTSNYPRITNKCISVYGEDDVDFSGLPHTRIGDFPEIDREYTRRNKLVVAAQRAVLKEATSIEGLPEWLQALLDGKLSFSRKAGCSCGCSPGFKSASNFSFVPERGFFTHVWVARKPVEEADDTID